MYSNNVLIERLSGLNKLNKLMRYLSILSGLLGILLLIDFHLPKEYYSGKIYFSESQKEVTIGPYKEAVNKNVRNLLKSGERVKLEISPLFDEIDTIISEESSVRIEHGTVDEFSLQIVGVVLFFPLLVFIKTSASDSNLKKRAHVFINLMSIILCVLVIVLWVRFILVHFLHVINLF